MIKESAGRQNKDSTGGKNQFQLLEICSCVQNSGNNIVALLSEYGAKKPSEGKIVQLRFIELADPFKGTENDLKQLMNRGASVDKWNEDGKTALIIAVKSIGAWHQNYFLNIAFLLKNGADPNFVPFDASASQEPPLHSAVFSTAITFKKNDRPKEFAELALKALLDHGAYVSGRDKSGKTPLHVAAKWDNIYAAGLLLARGSKVMPRDDDGKTPLDYAQSSEMITILKEHGAKEH